MPFTAGRHFPHVRDWLMGFNHKYLGLVAMNWDNLPFRYLSEPDPQSVIHAGHYITTYSLFKLMIKASSRAKSLSTDFPCGSEI